MQMKKDKYIVRERRYWILVREKHHESESLVFHAAGGLFTDRGRPRRKCGRPALARFDDAAGEAEFAPNGQRVGHLDLTRFRAFKTKTG